MRCPRLVYRTAAAALTILLIGELTACQTEKMAHRNFSPEQRLALQPGGPHEGTAETLTVIVNYRYRVDEKQPPARIMQLEGGIGRFKMKAESMTLHINFLDGQGVTLSNHLIYALGHKQGRDTFIRPSTTFAKELVVPPDSVYFALSSRTRLSRGKK